MIRLAAAAAAVVALLLWAGSTKAALPVVYVVNDSTSLQDTAVQDALPAFQASVSRELHRYWGVDATLVFVSVVPAGGMYIQLTDLLDDPFALAYHTVDANGVPYAVVGVETNWQAGDNWQNAFSHELDEMLVDPGTDRFTNIGKRSYRVEVCDPVERDSQGYWRRSLSGAPVLLSDFVTPAWYSLHKRGPFDLHLLVHRPLQVLPGGYAIWF